jgi:hypothetical protein
VRRVSSAKSILGGGCAFAFDSDGDGLQTRGRSGILQDRCCRSQIRRRSPVRGRYLVPVEEAHPKANHAIDLRVLFYPRARIAGK